jgi:hypothetical protein
MLKTRLEVILEQEKKIPHNLTGFRKGYSTMDNLSQLVTDIQISYSSNLNMITAIYDLQGAYDNVHIPTLISKLEKLGIPKSVCTVIHRYLVNRAITVKGIEGKSTP